MKSLLSSTKKKIVFISVLVIVAVIIGVIFFVLNMGKYRSITVQQLEGTAIITGEQGETEAYKGMHLNSGDDVEVQEKSNLSLVMDSDRYLYAEEETHFEIECVDGEKSGKKVIHFKDGSFVNRLASPLKDDEAYTVETPNATMSVKGTVFRVSVYRDEEGLVHTGIEVFSGKVQVDLRKENGDYIGVSETFEAGEAGTIIGNTEFAEFVVEEGTNTREIAYKKLPQDVARVLVGFIDDGEELCIEKILLMHYTGLAEHESEIKVDKKATCTEDGYKEERCVVCDEITENMTISATGHVMAEEEILQKPTCEKPGKKQQSCTACEFLVEEVIPELGHTEGKMQVISEATCTKEGLSRQSCTVCGEVLNSKKAKALGHTFGAWTVKKEATCATAGTQVRNCTRCGLEETQSIAAFGHIVEHEHQDLVRQGVNYVSCTCITYCTRPGCTERVSVTSSVWNGVLGIMVQYFCGNCNEQI